MFWAHSFEKVVVLAFSPSPYAFYCKTLKHYQVIAKCCQFSVQSTVYAYNIVHLLNGHTPLMKETLSTYYHHACIYKVIGSS